MMVRGLGAAGLVAALASAALAQEPAADPPVIVEVVEDPTRDLWSVTYRFAEPVKGVSFQRTRRPARRERWRLSREGLSWASEDGLESIAVEGDPVRELSFEFDSDFDALVKQYELNVAYSDGGRLLYSGQLSVLPLGATRAPDHHWKFRTSPERNVVVLDRQQSSALDWVEPAASTGNGTYVYFGPGVTERRGRMVYLADPGLPSWMREEVDELLPRLFDRYAEITGVELDFTPLVLLSYRSDDSSGLTFHGGTLDDLVQIAAQGRAWERKSRDASFLWLERTAHEAFHFWTGEMFTTALEPDEEWLTEGGADHYALLMASELGVLDPAGRCRLLVERANDCLAGLHDGPLLGATERSDFRRLYSCGSTLWLWASSAASLAADSTGEHAFVRELLAAAERDRRRLTTYGFLEAVHVLTGSHVAGEPLVRVLFQGAPAVEGELFAAQMRRSGCEVDVVAPGEATWGGRGNAPVGLEGSYLAWLPAESDIQ